MTPLAVINELKTVYSLHKTQLTYASDWQLLVAVILSAQCTDARVNMVTPVLFKKLPTIEAMADAPHRLIASLIASVTFAQSKARYLKASAQRIRTEFGGIVPDAMEKLVTLPGVGRKTANVILHVIHEKSEGVVVDTHIYRVSRRTGVTHATTPEKVEADIMRQLDKQHWIVYSDLVIQHGRKICHAKKPECAVCPLNKACPSAFTG